MLAGAGSCEVGLSRLKSGQDGLPASKWTEMAERDAPIWIGDWECDGTGYPYYCIPMQASNPASVHHKEVPGEIQ